MTELNFKYQMLFLWDILDRAKMLASQTSHLFKKLINLFLAVLDLHCYESFSLVVASRGYSQVAVCGLLIAAAYLTVEHGF